MATENIRAYEVKIEGANSVKELKKAISDMRDELVKLDNTSEDYNDVVQGLIIGEKKLKEVISAGKNEVTAAKGSYNALTQEMSALKKVWREVTSEAEREKIGQRIAEINTELKRMDASVGNFQRNVGDYEGAIKRAFLTPQQELRKLRIELAQLDPATEEYKKTFQRMSQLTHDVAEQQTLLKYSSSDLGDIIGNLVGVARGVAGGFAAINAAMGLMGSESEDVQKAMLKVQQFMGLIQGLGAVDDLIKRVEGLFAAFEGLGKVNEGVADATAVLMTTTTEAAGAATLNAAATAKETKENTNLNKVMVQTERIAQKRLSYLTEEGYITLWLRKQTELFTKSLMNESYARGVGQKGLNETQEALTYTSTLLARLEKGEISEAEAIGLLTNETAKNNSVLRRRIPLLQGVSIASKENATAETANATAHKASTTAMIGEEKALKRLWTSLKGFASSIVKWVATNPILTLLIAIAAELVLIAKGIHDIKDARKSIEVAQLTKEIEKQNEALEKNVALMKARGENDLKVINAEIEGMKALNEKYNDYQVRVWELFGEKSEKFEEAYKKWKEYHENFVSTLREAQYTLESMLSSVETKDAQKNMTDLEIEINNINIRFEQASALAGKLFDEGIINASGYLSYLQRIREDLPKAIEQATKSATKTTTKSSDEQKKKAEEVYKQAIEYFKSERVKLEEKYKEEKALLEKYGKDTTALTKKYEIEKTNIILKEMELRYKAIREYNAREASLLEDNTLEYFQQKLQDAKEMQEDFLETEVQKDEEGNVYAVLTKDLEALNGAYGLAMKDVSDFSQQMRLNEKAVKDAEKALANYISTQKMQTYNKASEEQATGTERKAQKSANDYNIKGSEQLWLGGLSLADRKRMMEEQYTILEEGLNKQIELWKKASEDPDLTGEARAEAHKKWAELVAQQEDTLAQHTIDSNTMMQDSFDTITNAMLSTAQSIADIMGSVADMMLSNAEAQLEAGDITQEQYEEEFEKAKAVQIAQATINTIAGAIGAFTQASATIPPPYGQIVGAATAAAVLAGGIAQIAQIKNTKPNSSSSSASSVRFTEVVPTLPDYQPEGVTNVTGEKEQTDLANALTKSPIKAYVVESEISDAQKKANTRNSESTF